MKIKITPLTSEREQLEGIFRVDNNFYFGKRGIAGIVTEIREDDDWLVVGDGWLSGHEMPWVSRSEIPFITALRQSQMIATDNFPSWNNFPSCVFSGTPFIEKYAPFFGVKDVDKFPSEEECEKLIRKHCPVLANEPYSFYTRDISNEDVSKLYRLFDYKSDLLVRGGSCIYKAYILINTSHTFAEEIYLNVYIALESIIEFLKLKEGLKRKKVVERIGSLNQKEIGGSDFKEYEEEMRDDIRNNIVHPYRSRYGEEVAKPHMRFAYIYEDLPLVDWLFKNLLMGKL